jgi:dGTP triphosphohydrolase
MLLRRFVKGAAPSDTSKPGPNEAKPSGPPVPDERDTLIRRLEQALAEERKNSSTLREAVDDLRFKTETLEKSYAKQLADARQKAATAEQALAAHKAEVATFGADREETIRLLTEARAELAQVTLDDSCAGSSPRNSLTDRSRPGATTVGESITNSCQSGGSPRKASTRKGQRAGAATGRHDCARSRLHETP